MRLSAAPALMLGAGQQGDRQLCIARATAGATAAALRKVLVVCTVRGPERPVCVACAVLTPSCCSSPTPRTPRCIQDGAQDARHPAGVQQHGPRGQDAESDGVHLAPALVSETPLWEPCWWYATGRQHEPSGQDAESDQVHLAAALACETCIGLGTELVLRYISYIQAAKLVGRWCGTLHAFVCNCRSAAHQVKCVSCHKPESCAPPACMLATLPC